MKKIMNFFIVSVLFLAFTAPSPILAKKLDTYTIKENDIVAGQNSIVFSEVKITGKKPVLQNYTNAKVQKQVNQAIDDIFAMRLKNIEDNGNGAKFSYEIIENTTSGIISLLIYTEEESDSMNQYVDTINFNADSIIKITDKNALDANGVKLANDYIVGIIKENPEKYSSNFKGIDENQDFYIDGKKLILLFDKYEIAPGTEGITIIEMDYNNVININVKNSDYIIKPDYKVKMIQLVQITDIKKLGYTLDWDAKTGAIEVSQNNRLVATMKIGSEFYSKGNRQKKALEYSPEIIDNRTYVPISFFEEILDFTYYVYENGDIVFSKYLTDKVEKTSYAFPNTQYDYRYYGR